MIGFAFLKKTPVAAAQAVARGSQTPSTVSGSTSTGESARAEHSESIAELTRKIEQERAQLEELKNYPRQYRERLKSINALKAELAVMQCSDGLPFKTQYQEWCEKTAKLPEVLPDTYAKLEKGEVTKAWAQKHPENSYTKVDGKIDIYTIAPAVAYTEEYHLSHGATRKGGRKNNKHKKTTTSYRDWYAEQEAKEAEIMEKHPESAFAQRKLRTQQYYSGITREIMSKFERGKQNPTELLKRQMRGTDVRAVRPRAGRRGARTRRSTGTRFG